jgi:hypothetical protein
MNLPGLVMDVLLKIPHDAIFGNWVVMFGNGKEGVFKWTPFEGHGDLPF